MSRRRWRIRVGVDVLLQRDQIGSALAWYLRAKRMHPMSEMARDGIKRLVEIVKNGDQPPPTNTDPTSALNN